MDNPTFSIIIVSYKSLAYLKPCLSSLSTHLQCRYEVILVDNHSQDDTVEWVHKHYPEIRVIEQGHNSGFAAANNQGARIARGKYLVLLNADTEVRSDFGAALPILEHKDVGVVGVKLVNPDGTIQPSVGYQHSPARILLSWLGLSGMPFFPSLFRRDVLLPAYYEEDHPDVAWVCGACMMIKKEAWEAVGGMDEHYFMYVEDHDLCRTLSSVSSSTAYCSRIEVMHHGGGGVRWASGNAMRSTLSSYRYFLGKHYGRYAVLVYRAVFPVVMVWRTALHAILGCLRPGNGHFERAGIFWQSALHCFAGK
jgi:GT2 family glycosyltransferase